MVDSDWLIDALRGVPQAIATLDRLSGQGIGVSIISVAELYEGAFRGPDAAGQLRDYRRFLAPFAVLPLTDAVAERFASVRALLRQQGNLAPDLDLLIGATAIEYDLTLLTRNLRHFVRIPGLRLFEER
jgi:tRNA(fMet)-specific endonuclease VapC